MIRITCPCCGVGINAEERLVGQTVRCPKCLGITKVVRPNSDDLAQVVESSYAPQPQDDDKPQATNCPKCSAGLPPGEYLCKSCGYHTKLEAYFEDLTEEALARGSEPKTKMEKWLDEQLHELATPRDVLIASGLCAAFVGFVTVVAGRIFFGPALGTILGLIAAGGIGYGWYVLMQRLGILKDPQRETRLQRERMNDRAKVPRNSEKSRSPSETFAKPIPESSPASSTTTERISLSDEEYDVDDIDLFADESNPKKAKPASSSPGSQSSSRAAKDDDWLNDLL